MKQTIQFVYSLNRTDFTSGSTLVISTEIPKAEKKSILFSRRSETMTGEGTEIQEAPVLLCFREKLSSCSESIKGGDESLVSDLVTFIDSVSEAALSEPENEDAQNNALQVLFEIHRFLLSPSLDQVVIDTLSFELPKAVSKFVVLSDKCLEIADSVIDHLIATCNPRDMLSILCEALDSSSGITDASGYISPLLSGLSKVFLSIQRRHYEQLKVAVPVILKVLKAAFLELADGDTECMHLFGRALDIANSFHTVCTKLEGGVSKKLHALLGLYILQIMALLSFSMGHNTSSCLYPVSQLANFFPYCGLSYLGLITGSEIDAMTDILIGDDDLMSCFTYIKHGACLSVIWAHIYDEVAQAAGGNMSAVDDELQNDQTKRWQALGMLKHIFSSANPSWELRKHAIDYLLCITKGNTAQKCNDGQNDCSVYLPSLCATLQAVINVIMFAPSSDIRKNAFEALKRVLADTPTSERFDLLQALIKNSDSSSMIAILLDLVRGELHMESCKRSTRANEAPQIKNKTDSGISLWHAGVLELVELVLRPPKGGPPPFPEHADAVLAALNLYRFMLMTESAGKTNYTGVLSKTNLQKAYNEWLLPLQTLVAGIMAENKNEHDEVTNDIPCSLNPVELVLYHCIELVEEKLKHST